MNKFLIVLLAALPLSALAHGNKVATTAAGVDEALKIFQKNQPDQIAKFAGVKGWLAGTKIMSRVYLSDKTEVLYSCTMTEMGGGKPDLIECTKTK